MVEPMERSNPPAMITRVSPAAAMPTITRALPTFIRLYTDRKYGDAKLSTIKTTTVATTRPGLIAEAPRPQSLEFMIALSCFMRLPLRKFCRPSSSRPSSPWFGQASVRSASSRLRSCRRAPPRSGRKC